MGAPLPGQAVVLCLLSLVGQATSEVRVRIPPSFWRAHKLGGVFLREGVFLGATPLMLGIITPYLLICDQFNIHPPLVKPRIRRRAFCYKTFL